MSSSPTPPGLRVTRVTPPKAIEVFIPREGGWLQEPNSCHYVALSAMVTLVSLLLSFIRVIDKKFQRKNNYW